MSETLFLQLCRFGDCLQSTVLIASWRQRYPEEWLVVLTHSTLASAFQANPDIDEVLQYDPPRGVLTNPSSDPVEQLDAISSWLEPLQRRGFRTVVNLTNDPFSGWLVLALRPAVLRGLAIDATDKMIANDPWSLYLLSLLNYRRLNLLNLADISAHFSGGPALREAPRFVVDGESRDLASRWLEETQADACIGFQPGASKVERRWPAESFIRLGRELAQTQGARVLVFGSGDEEALARSISDQIPNARSFAGKTSIPQLAALLERCKVLVTNDTGTMHLAAAVGTRIVALFESSAYFRETGPYGSGHWIIQSREVRDYGARSEEELNRTRRIPVEDVSAAVTTLLAEPRGGACQVPLGASVDHYRSTWSDGLVDFLPVAPVPMEREDLCSRLQRPIWLALLDGRDPNPDRAADAALATLKIAYAAPSGFDVSEALEQFLKDVRQTGRILKRLWGIIDATLQKLRKNPAYLVPDDQLSKMTEIENAVLRTGASMAVQPFIAYFEAALAMVAGNDTRQYLQSYRQPVLFLAKQLRAMAAVLKSVSSRLDHR